MHPATTFARILLQTWLCCVLSVGVSASDSNKLSATVTIDPSAVLGRIDPNIYGQYLEHVQPEDECIYPSLWDTNSSFADSSGLRRDVIAAVRDLRTPVVRWPGGCFADVYHWRDGVGPRDKRPVRINKHWGGEESNQFGTDEFLNWCQQTGAAAYINANLGTGTLEECLDWLSYCNSKQPRAHFWGIGNETFAPWEAGHMDAPTYSKTVAAWAAAVGQQERQVKIMAVGSMSAQDPAWDTAVLRNAGDNIDFLTLHAYGYSTGRRKEFESVAFTPVFFEQRLRKMLNTIDQAGVSRSSKEPIRIAMDEWNIRHYHGDQLDRKDPRTLQDAVFVAGVLNSMIRLSPRVAMANYVFLVNGNGVLLVNSNQVVRTPLFYTFQKFGEWMQGQSLDLTLKCSTTIPPLPQAHTPKHRPPADFPRTPQPWLDVSAALREDGSVAVAVVNRHPEAAINLQIRLPKKFKPASSWTYYDADVFASNTFAAPNRLLPKLKPLSSGNSFALPGHSVTLLLFATTSK